MPINDELDEFVRKVFVSQWTEINGQKVPETESVPLGNTGVKLDVTILYADMADSTRLVDTHSESFAAEIYKTYLYCACKIIRLNSGTIVSFDGDRVMSVFHGGSKNTDAVKSALQINGAVTNIINKQLDGYNEFRVVHACGVDTGEVLVARTGIRGSNDLVWIGSCANHAAKLCGLREDNMRTWVSENVYDNMNDALKWWKNGEYMWEWRSGYGLVAASNWWVRPGYNPVTGGQA